MLDEREIAELIRKASRKLFSQFKYSNGFTSIGQSELLEAALVAHIAAEFITHNHVVWPESPFRDKKKGSTKHLDLLIHLNPKETEAPNVITLEAKAISPGHEATKADEIITDHKRICDWKVLDPSGQPIFFAIEPPQSVRGILAVLLTEGVDEKGNASSPALSNWWRDLGESPKGLPEDRVIALSSILQSATLRGVERSTYLLDRERHSVAFAIFGCEVQSSTENLHTKDEEDTSEHEAAHAIVALRSRFRVHYIALERNGDRKGGVQCDWKASRQQYANDYEIVKRAFALAYAGCIIDMGKQKRSLSEVLDSLPTDVKQVEDVRQTAVDWQVVSAISETKQLSEEGFALAEQLLEENRDLIAGLTDELLDLRVMDEQALLLWYQEHTANEIRD